ncbi:hypothetical protein Q5P01_002869 [Channa striata]|uniref:C-type lectin domain-containing protein n=1 Tax=Channa striata TaxID=64152 RepID=A0AA88NTJ3_CHASR|nr:hypothetical protein Q5P01_002869 [Channa striata]
MVLAGGSDLVNKSVTCSEGWFHFDGRCFKYVQKPMSWSKAELNCLSMGAHLASVHNLQEYEEIQRQIVAATHHYNETWIGGSDAQLIHCQSVGGHLASMKSERDYDQMRKLTGNKPTWIGGSDAQEESVWLWSDGETFVYTKWCKGEPNNFKGSQHCLAMNHRGRRGGKHPYRLTLAMKILTVCALGWAMMALTKAAGETAPDDQTESSDLDKRRLFCPSGWTKTDEGCFQFLYEPKTWAEAEKRCQSEGGHLTMKSQKCGHHLRCKVRPPFACVKKRLMIGGWIVTLNPPQTLITHLHSYDRSPL